MDLLEEVAFSDLRIRAWPIAHWKNGSATLGKTLPNSGCSPGATVKLPGVDRRLHGLTTMRIGATGAALIGECCAHENRAERVYGSPDASWGRWSDSMSNELTQNRLSGSPAPHERLNYAPSTVTERKTITPGITITGPDAEDIHGARGDA